MARLLPPDLKATFISGSIAAILEYLEHPQIDVILLGDKISKNSKITVGTDTIAKVKRIRVDICFLGINAIDLQHGITDNDMGGSAAKASHDCKHHSGWYALPSPKRSIVANLLKFAIWIKWMH